MFNNFIDWVFSFLSFACSPVQDTNIRTPARELYNQAVIASEDQFYTEAEELFRKLSTEHSGTQLATLAYLQLGELFFKRTKWDDAEVNYRSFLIRNPQQPDALCDQPDHRLNYEEIATAFSFVKDLLIETWSQTVKSFRNIRDSIYSIDRVITWRTSLNY